jgi:hypothetical protein
LNERFNGELCLFVADKVRLNISEKQPKQPKRLNISENPEKTENAEKSRKSIRTNKTPKYFRKSRKNRKTPKNPEKVFEQTQNKKGVNIQLYTFFYLPFSLQS